MSGFLTFAYALSGPGRGAPLTAEADILEALRAEDLAWLHLRADAPETRAWLETNITFVDRHAIAALVAEETRPRTLALDTGCLVNLRGVNANPGADPEDMVSIRLWVAPERILSLSRRPVAELDEITARVTSGTGPDRAGAFLALLADRLGLGIETFLRALDDACDEIEESVLEGPQAALRARITATRQKVIGFRRYIAPQRDAIDRLLIDRPGFLMPEDIRRLSETHDRLTRAVEDLDAMRDRLAIMKDELTNLLSERLNRNLYILSVITVIFLPLGFLTGLFGINVGGIPGADWPAAFATFAGILVVIVIAQVIWFRWRGWF